MKSYSRIAGGSRVAWTWLVLFLASLAWGHTALAQAPTILEFAPVAGKPGTSVKITGTGFLTTRHVFFNSKPAIFWVEDDTILRVTLQDDAVTGPIAVNTLGGTFTTTSNFTVAPRITELAPGRGLSGTQVKIVGSNLNNATNVMFGGIPAAFALLSDTQISAFVPTGATNALVTVMTPVGDVISTNEFLVTDVPLIKSFQPTTASVGQSVVIDGGDFSTATNVLFNGQAASSFVITAPNQIQAVIPTTATVGPISVQTPGGTAVSATNLITGAGPIITGFSPIAGPVGKQVIITGTGFSGVTVNNIKFNGVSCISGGATADTQIQVFVPASATTGPISVTKGTNTFTTSSNFIVGTFPIINSFSPASGPVGTQVTISGENFPAGTVVKFGDITSDFFQRTADTQISARVPPGATNAPITLITSTHTNQSNTPFLVSGAAPTVVDVFPQSGQPGGNVTLYGFGFSGVTAVKLNGQNVQEFRLTVNSGTNQIGVTLPSDATSGVFTVTTPNGTSSSSVSFYVWPKVEGFTPQKATTDSSLVVTGLNFTGASELRIGDLVIPAANLTIQNNQISCFVPFNARSGPLTVKTPAGLMTIHNNFGVLPKITGITPDRARVGDVVTLDGSGFFDLVGITVSGQGVIPSAFTVESLNRIKFTVPIVPSSGPVRVTTVEGSATFGSPLLILPTIQGFDPLFAPIGSNVVVSGYSFLNVTNVRLGSVDMPFTILGSSSIRATVPTGISGNIVLFNDAGFTTSTDAFIIQPKLRTQLTTDGKVLVQWPLDVVPFKLRSTITLDSPIPWADDNSQVFSVDGFSTVTNDSPQGMRYYRLYYPLPE